MAKILKMAGNFWIFSVDISANKIQIKKRGEISVEGGWGNLSILNYFFFFYGLVRPKTDVKNPKKLYNFLWAPLVFLKLLENYDS
jgi:hypothetical protein